MTRLHVVTPGRARFLTVGVLAVLLSACSQLADVSNQVQNTVSGALVPVKQAADEITRRANEVGEGIQGVTAGMGKIQGAFSGSGATW